MIAEENGAREDQGGFRRVLCPPSGFQAQEFGRGLR